MLPRRTPICSSTNRVVLFEFFFCSCPSISKGAMHNQGNEWRQVGDCDFDASSIRVNHRKGWKVQANKEHLSNTQKHKRTLNYDYQSKSLSNSSSQASFFSGTTKRCFLFFSSSRTFFLASSRCVLPRDFKSVSLILFPSCWYALEAQISSIVCPTTFVIDYHLPDAHISHFLHFHLLLHHGILWSLVHFYSSSRNGHLKLPFFVFPKFVFLFSFFSFFIRSEEPSVLDP